MTSKTGWCTQADYITNFKELSKSVQAYRLSQKVWIDPDPALEAVREANRKSSIIYKVRIGYTYVFDSAQDAFRFEYVHDRAYYSYADFVQELDAGRVWSSGDVEVWKEANKDAVIIMP